MKHQLLSFILSIFLCLPVVFAQDSAGDTGTGDTGSSEEIQTDDAVGVGSYTRGSYRKARRKLRERKKEKKKSASQPEQTEPEATDKSSEPDDSTEQVDEPMPQDDEKPMETDQFPGPKLEKLRAPDGEQKHRFIELIREIKRVGPIDGGEGSGEVEMGDPEIEGFEADEILDTIDGTQVGKQCSILNSPFVNQVAECSQKYFPSGEPKPSDPKRYQKFNECVIPVYLEANQAITATYQSCGEPEKCGRFAEILDSSPFLLLVLETVSEASQEEELQMEEVDDMYRFTMVVANDLGHPNNRHAVEAAPLAREMEQRALAITIAGQLLHQEIEAIGEDTWDEMVGESDFEPYESSITFTDDDGSEVTSAFPKWIRDCLKASRAGNQNPDQ